MSAISSLYGSPNPSMVSRDPAGVAVDEYIRLEPTGSRADESGHHIVISPTSAAHHAHKDGGVGPLTNLEILDVARLVGAPPPPPKTPPPKKLRRRTPKHTNSRAGVTPKMTNVGSFTSFDEDSLLQSLAASSPKSVGVVSPTENGEKTIHTRNTSGSSSPDSVKIDMPPRRMMEYDEHQLTVPIDIIEERVRAAMELYEREDLVLDDVDPAADDAFRPAMAIIENQLGLPLVLPTEVEKISKIESPRDALPSPRSPKHAQTSPHNEASWTPSNKARENSRPFVANVSTVNTIHDAPIDAVSPKNMEPPGQQLPEPYRRTHSVERQNKKVTEEKQKRDLKRGFFKKLFRGRTKNRGEVPKSRESSPAVPASPRSKSSTISRSSPRSLSSQRSRSRSSSRITSSSPRSRSRSSTRRSPSPRGYMSVTSPKSNASPRRPRDPAIDNRQPATKPASPRLSMTLPKRQPHPLKPVLKSEVERQYQGPTVTAQIEQEPDLVVEQPTAPLPTPIVNHNVKESVSIVPTNEQSFFAFSQDPPDDEHGDPPEFSGRPLISPSHRVITPKNDDEVSRLESVKSRIAELYEGRAHDAEEGPDDEGPLSHLPSSVSHDRNEYFFAHDEVSALTGTFGSKSFDPFANDSNEEQTVDHVGATPREVIAEPASRKFVDSKAAVLVNSISTPAHVSKLRVQIHGPSQDPAGASPMKWNYRGHPLKEAGFRDPVGESPLHAWNGLKPNDTVADPPLTTGFVEDDADEIGIFEEKKEEDNVIIEENPSMSSSNSETPFEKDFMIGHASESKGSASRKKSSSSQRIAKVNGLISIDEHADSAPTPKISTSGTKRVISKQVTASQKKEGPGSSLDTTPESLPKQVEKASINVGKDQELTVKTDVEKAGFKSASNTPVSSQKALTITTAAFTNAKAVAYLHRLHGEPSPRHTWHTSNRKQSESSPLAKKVKARAKKKSEPTSSSASHKKPSPDEYGAHNFDETLLVSDATETLKVTVAPEELHVMQTKEGALFSAYNAKFQGRKPSKKKVTKVETPTGSRLSLSSRGRADVETFNDARTTPVNAVVKPGKITGWAVAKGIQLRRNKRDYNIATGKSARIVLTPRKKPEGRNRFKFVPQNEDEIKDPIQRAGRRLLSKAAIPIQCAVRRYLARREAIDRMWALIEIQSYCRRWRAETNLQANIHSAVQIQRAFRGWLARDQLNHMHSAATQIQRILRGYLCQAKVYDTMYYIVRIQALFKGCYVRKMQQKKSLAAIDMQRYIRGFSARLQVLRNSKAIPIQAAYRGHKARQEYAVATASVKIIQSSWRAYTARIAFQIEIVDIIIVQSVVRRWAACRQTKLLRELELYGPTSIIQAAWRGHVACREYKKQKAARKIQTIWRGFQCYSDYIFTLVDVLLVQRTARRWLAIRKKNQLKKEYAATKIQSCWRRHKARCTLLFSLVHIIIAQSVVRRFLSRFVVQKRQAEIKALQSAEQEKHDAATAIQKIWRGFIGFSHYIIVQYEIARLQAIVRGKLARQAYNLKLGCAIIIQANIRRHLAKTAIEKRMIAEAITESAALALRERNAAKRIQFWWRIVLDWTKEKKAALTIERFFIRVREEVDREIMRRERRKMMKKEKRRQKRRESDEMMLERAWLNTVDENTAVGTVGTFSRDSCSELDSRSKSAPPLREERKPMVIRDGPREAKADLGLRNGLLSPKLSNVGQEVDINGWPIQRVDSSNSRIRPPTDSIPMSTSEDHSEVSNITNPTVFNRMSQPPGHFEAPGRPTRDKRMSTEDYIKKYGSDGGGSGPQKTQNRISSSQANSKPQHFFSDNGGAGERNAVTSIPVILPPNPHLQSFNPVNVPSTPTSRRRSSSSPKSHMAPPNFGPSVPTPRGGGMAATPRVPGGVPSTPRSNASPHQVPSPRIQVGFPPATPRSHKSNKLHISRRETAETESHTTYSQNSFSKASPHSRSDGNVVLMKSYPNFLKSHSIEDGQEVLYLGDADLGDEYGEV